MIATLAWCAVTLTLGWWSGRRFERLVIMSRMRLCATKLRDDERLPTEARDLCAGLVMGLTKTIADTTGVTE